MTPLADLATHWPRLSVLLDQALELPSAERAAWIDALQGEPAGLKDTLRRLLTARPGVDTYDFLAALPRMGEPAPSAAAALRTGVTVGPYRLLRPLGEGGMGSVWLAERNDGHLGRQVALKLPHFTWAGNLFERMARERDILATLDHPNIARLYDAGIDALGRPWLALEHVQGQTIEHYASERGLDVAARVQLLLQVCAAVAYAHSRLVIHRDLKPSNLLVTEQGRVRLLDFGIAKLVEGERAEETALTRAAGRALTPDYASPEQIRGEPLTTASDVYSLGVVAYTLLSGQSPYALSRGSAAELEEAIASADVPLASQRAQTAELKQALRGDLDAILNRALAKDPAERYATVDAMAQDFARHLAGDAVSARPDSAWSRLRRFARRQRRPLIAAAVVVAAFGLGIGAGATALVILTLLLGLAAALWQARRAESRAREARTQTARAEAVQRFLLDIFQSNTDRQQDAVHARQATARELLDRGAARVETALADAPEARIEVLGTLAQMYAQLMLAEQSDALQQRMVALVRQVHGARDRRLAEALVGLANIRFHVAPVDQVLPLLHEAQAVLDALGEPESSLRGRLLANLAMCHQKISTPEMRRHAEEAVRVLGSGPEAKSVHMSTALQMAGWASLDLGDVVRAEGHLRRGLEVLRALPAMPHVAFGQVSSTLAACLRCQHRHLDAARVYGEAHADALAHLGAEEPMTHTLAACTGLELHLAGRRTEGRELLRAAVDGAQRLDRGEYFLCLARRDLARALHAEGDLAQARALLESSLETLRRQMGGSAWFAWPLHEHGLILAAMGDEDEAAARFDEAMAVRLQSAGDGPRTWRVNRLLVDRARFEFDRGRASAAKALLDQWVDDPSAPLALPAEQFERELLCSRLHLAERDIAAAVDQAERAVAAIEASPAQRELPVLRAMGHLGLARARLAFGEAAEALGPAQIAARWHQVHDHAASPWAAEAELVLAQVLYTLGRRDEAVSVAAQAAARHAANHGLAEHLRMPLREFLERRGTG